MQIDFPGGCKECSTKNDWQCLNGCYWREESWKYDELKYYTVLAQWKKADVPIRDIDDLQPEDYIKISIIEKRL